MNMQRKQNGASFISLLITVAVLGYGVYVGLQYFPQFIESGTVNSILDNIKKNHRATPYRDTREIMSAIKRQLDMNLMNDMEDKFYITRNVDGYLIEVNYNRELDLYFEKKLMKYEKSLTLHYSR